MTSSIVAARVALSMIVAALYVTACILPAVDNPPPTNRDFGDITPYGQTPGIVALLFGALPETFVAWSANPLLLTGWILFLFKKNTIAVWFGAGAVLAAISTHLFLPKSMSLLIGYYFWLGSLIAFTFGTLAVRTIERSRASKPH